ncbi:MAG: hypothetical protein LBS00_12780 [Synergistaceae bacterium]|jgi:hypothetical protein|nr:hypothetical protein [Synergistaceae bacterium]
MQTGAEVMTNEQMQLIMGLVYDIVMKAQTLEEARETLAKYVPRENKRQENETRRGEGTLQSRS